MDKSLKRENAMCALTTKPTTQNTKLQRFIIAKSTVFDIGIFVEFSNSQSATISNTIVINEFTVKDGDLVGVGQIYCSAISTLAAAEDEVFKVTQRYIPQPYSSTDYVCIAKIFNRHIVQIKVEHVSSTGSVHTKQPIICLARKFTDRRPSSHYCHVPKTIIDLNFSIF